MRRSRFWAMALAVSLVLAFVCSCGDGEKPPLLDQENVKSSLSDHEVIILDVRASKDWNVSDKKIKGAMRQDPDEVATWAVNLPKNKKIILYCQKEGTIVRVARKLNELGFKQVLALKGGWNQWEKAGYPTEPK
jgi:hydroxyacylglutathione hydrolase